MPYHTIGDANNVGTIKDAIHAGYDIAKKIVKERVYDYY